MEEKIIYRYFCKEFARMMQINNEDLLERPLTC